MKLLLTGATGYIAQRLIPVLIDQGNDQEYCQGLKMAFT